MGSIASKSTIVTCDGDSKELGLEDVHARLENKYIMEQPACLDFPFPNEIIEIVISYLSTEELLDLATIASERLKKCTFSVLGKKSSDLLQLLCDVSAKKDWKKTKQIFAYIKQANITGQEIDGNLSKFRENLPRLLGQMSFHEDFESLKQIFACIRQENITVEEIGDVTSELKKRLSESLCQMPSKRDFEVLNIIFSLINHGIISEEEIELMSKHFNQGKNSTLIDMYVGSTRYLRGLTPLMLAAAMGHSHVCEYLIIRQNADVEARDENQSTALIVASRNNKKDVVKMLVDLNCNVKAQDKCENHAAYFAAENGNLEILKCLVEKERNVIDLMGEKGTPLMVASFPGRISVCKYLIGMNADVNVQNKIGNTALHRACFYNEIDVVKILLSNGAMDLKNVSNESASDFARRQKHEKIVEILAKHFNGTQKGTCFAKKGSKRIVIKRDKPF